MTRALTTGDTITARTYDGSVVTGRIVEIKTMASLNRIGETEDQIQLYLNPCGCVRSGCGCELSAFVKASNIIDTVEGGGIECVGREDDCSSCEGWAEVNNDGLCPSCAADLATEPWEVIRVADGAIQAGPVTRLVAEHSAHVYSARSYGRPTHFARRRWSEEVSPPLNT